MRRAAKLPLGDGVDKPKRPAFASAERNEAVVVGRLNDKRTALALHGYSTATIPECDSFADDLQLGCSDRALAEQRARERSARESEDDDAGSLLPLLPRLSDLDREPVWCAEREVMLEIPESVTVTFVEMGPVRAFGAGVVTEHTVFAREFKFSSPADAAAFPGFPVFAQYDGKRHGVLNFKNRFLFSHSLLRNFLVGIILGAATFSSYLLLYLSRMMDVAKERGEHDLREELQNDIRSIRGSQHDGGGLSQTGFFARRPDRILQPFISMPQPLYLAPAVRRGRRSADSSLLDRRGCRLHHADARYRLQRVSLPPPPPSLPVSSSFHSVYPPHPTTLNLQP